MLKRWCLAASLLMLAVLLLKPAAVAAESARSFRQQNGLLAYAPPNWFLEGYFIAREKKPTYVFGPVKEFVRTIGGTTAWLIADLELERLQQSSADGKKTEYPVFLKSVLPDRTEYWVFAEETCGDYCAGCGRLCSDVLSGKVPINDVMRCLMYYHRYQDLGLARSTFETVPTRTKALLAQMDFSEAEKYCPRNLPIGRLMREAATLLA